MSLIFEFYVMFLFNKQMTNSIWNKHFETEITNTQI